MQHRTLSGPLRLLATIGVVLGLVGAGSQVPVPFDHSVHAGALDMPCAYCHSGVLTGDAAGMPSLERCMGCHRFIQRDNPGVVALVQQHEQGLDAHWERAYSLPGDIRFSHRAHVTGGVSCVDCHGDVRQMGLVKPVKHFDMPTCLSCHSARQAPVDCVICHE